jgi:hypothetical protein
MNSDQNKIAVVKLVMKRFIISLCIITLCIDKVKSQVSAYSVSVFKSNDTDFRILIIKVLGRYMNSKRLFGTPKDNAHVFSLSLSFNLNGKVDTVYLSDKMPSRLKEIIIVGPELTKALDSIDFSKEFRNKIVILPIVLKRWEDQRIENSIAFFNEFSTIWPSLNGTDKFKQIIVLDPFINTYFTTK